MLLGIGGVLWWRGRHGGALVCAALGSLLVLMGLAVPRALGPLRRGWMAVAELLSRVTTPVFMAVLYLVVLTPVGMLMRLFARNPVLRPRTAQSGWIPRAETRSDLEHQF